jgi:LysR family transcriptional regulator, glycine cleavage system transcriptional activator
VLLEEDDHRSSAEYLSWRRWLHRHAIGPAQAPVQPKAWLYLNFTYQQMQAAIAGQGVALARLPLMAQSLKSGEWVEPFGPGLRDASPYRYWLLPFPNRRQSAALVAFETWLQAQARQTRLPARRSVALSTAAAALK